MNVVSLINGIRLANEDGGPVSVWLREHSLADRKSWHIWSRKDTVPERRCMVPLIRFEDDEEVLLVEFLLFFSEHIYAISNSMPTQDPKDC